MKRKISLILSLLMAFTCFCSCKGQTDSGSSSSSSSSDSSNEEVLDNPSAIKTVSETEGYDFSEKLGNVLEYSIVIADKPSPAEKTAAIKLGEYVQSVTGSKIGYVADGGDYSSKKVISIGRTAAFENSGFEADEETLNGDGFIVKSLGDDLYICGGIDRGTLYGVYDIVEYFFGVKFLTADYTHIPNNPNAAIYKSDRTSIPAFDYRAYLNTTVFQDVEKDYFTQRRFTSEYISLGDEYGGNIKWYQTAHTHGWYYYTDFDLTMENGKVKPEYLHCYANNGEDVIMNGSQPYDICYTDGINEDGTYTEYVDVNGTRTETAIGMAIRKLKEMILTDGEENNFYMFGQADTSSRPCICSRCMDASNKYTNGGMMVRFANCLSDAINAWKEGAGVEREINVIVFAYLWSEQPPVETIRDSNNAITGYKLLDDTCKARENVYIRFAPIHAQRTLPYSDELQAQNARYGSDYFQRWALAGENFFLWSYHADFAWTAYWWSSSMMAMQQNLIELKDFGIRYVFMQGFYLNPSLYSGLIEAYVSSKMMWNPYYDMNSIIKEFNYYYFGDVAGQYADEFIELMDGVYTKAIAEARETGGRYTTQDSTYESNVEWWTKGIMTRAVACFDDGIAAVNANASYSDVQKKTYVSHLEMAQLMPRYMYLFNATKYGMSSTDQAFEVQQFIKDSLVYGGTIFREGNPNKFDLENLIWRP